MEFFFKKFHYIVMALRDWTGFYVNRMSNKTFLEFTHISVIFTSFVKYLVELLTSMTFVSPPYSA